VAKESRSRLFEITRASPDAKSAIDLSAQSD